MMKARTFLKMILSNTYILDFLEYSWTGKKCKMMLEEHSEHTVIASLAYRARFSRDWGVAMTLSCLAFDVADFAALYGHTGLKRPDCLQYIFDSK
jgi:hypothetical protein